MNFIKGLGKLFTGNTNSEDNQNFKNAPSRLKGTRFDNFQGKMVKDYSFQNQIVEFQNPSTQLVSGTKQDGKKVSIYALQKSTITPQSFIAYQNALANNYHGIYPQYIEHIQSTSFIYIVLEQLTAPQSKSWMAEDLLDQIEQLALKAKEKLSLKGILVNGMKKLAYLPPYHELKNFSKIYYDGVNKTVFAQLFCRVFELPDSNRQKVYDKIVQFACTNNLKSQVVQLLTSVDRKQFKSQQIWIGNNPSSQPYQPKFFNKTQFPNQNIINQPFSQPNSKSNKPSQLTNQNQETLYPDISAEDQEIMKLISGVKVNPKLFQGDSASNLRASVRAKHEDQEETKQIGQVIDHAKKSMFEISKVVKKSIVKSAFENKYEQAISNNQFEVYCSTYISIFQHLKRTVKSSLSFYTKGFSGIINAYFLTLIGILRRSQLVYALRNDKDIFGIGCQSANVQFYTGRLKKELVSEARILTDLREMIFRCYIPYSTMQILEPFLDDHIDNIDPVKLEDFTFFYMSSLMKNDFREHVHFINSIECMYIILHRGFEVVHFESDFPRKWDDDFFTMRKCLIQSMVPGWGL